MDWSPGYREWLPPPPLAGSVTCVWMSVAQAGSELASLVLPDGCADLIWQSGRGVFAAGPDTGPAPALMPPGTVLVGVRFAPGAGGAALQLPLADLLNLRVDAADLGGWAGPALAGRVPGSLEPPRALRELLGVTGDLVARRPPDPLVMAAARLLGHPDATVGEVAAALGVSARHLRRRCQQEVGYGPATLRRVLRFRRFVDRVDTGADRPAPERSAGQDRSGPGAGGPRASGYGLASMAAAVGYADQAHLTRECGEFAGLTPRALIRVRVPGTA